MSLSDPRSILITGAARGLGAALANTYARPGVALFLVDVREELLAETALLCQETGAAVHSRVIDIRDRAAMEDWIVRSDRESPLDLVLANAALSHGSWIREETKAEARAVFATNLDGLLNTIHPALDLMRPRGRGQVALFSSPAGIRGMPVAPSYGATKAAIRVYGEALASRLRREGIVVSVIQPGFIQTPMTGGNKYRMPLIMAADKAARIIKKRLAKGRIRIVFPWPVALGLWLLRVLPGPLVDRAVRLK